MLLAIIFYFQDRDLWLKTPTNTKSSPAYNYNVSTSNVMDHTPSRTINRITTGKWTDLASLLTSEGLEKYIGLFVSHEIDLTTFPSLTDRDLVEVGITAFGARRKMLLLIAGKKTLITSENSTMSFIGRDLTSTVPPKI